MANHKQRELVWASAGLIALGIIGYLALEWRRASVRPDTEPMVLKPIPNGTKDNGTKNDGATERALTQKHAPPTLTPTSAIPGHEGRPSAQISGRVRDMLSDRGVADVTVTFAVIALAESAASSATTSSSTSSSFGPGTLTAEFDTVSTEDGHYRLTLPAGRYKIRASGADVVALPETGTHLHVAAGTEPNGDSDRRVDNVDIHVVRLARIHGRVADEHGRPLAAIRVGHHTRIFEQILDSDDTVPVGEAISATDGAFTLQVPPGAVRLTAEGDGRPQATTVVHWVAPGSDLRGIEILMPAGAEITGQVVDPAGTPVPEARIVAEAQRSTDTDADADARARQPGQAPEARHLVAEGYSDDDGQFHLRHLPPGTVHLTATAAGHGASKPVAAVAAPTTQTARSWTLRLRPLAEIAGHVNDDGGNAIAGAAISVACDRNAPPSGSGSGSVRVDIADASLTLGTFETDPATTDDGGHFRMAAPKGGRCGLTVRAAGYTDLHHRIPRPIKATTSVTLTMLRAGAIAGHVTGGGIPRRNILVRAERQGFLPQTESANNAKADRNPDAAWLQRQVRSATGDGRFTIDDVPPGRYTVTAAAPGFAPAEARDIIVRPGNTSRTTIELSPGASIAGTVRDEDSGRPVSGALIRTSTGSETAVAYSDADGRFTIADIRPGRRSVEVQHPAHIGRIISGLVLVAGEEHPLEVTVTAIPFGADQTIEFAGIGAALAQGDRGLVVQQLLPRGPAESAGIQVGDIVVTIDGAQTATRSLADNIEDIRGIAGTVVRLTIAAADSPNDGDSRTLDDNIAILDIVRGTVRYTPQD